MYTPKTRKPHKKSRRGCLPCKARHIKCDEQQPACVNCDKHGTRCDYPKARTSVSFNMATSPTAFGNPSSTHSLAPIQSSVDTTLNGSQEVLLGVAQMRLLHHFTTVTAKTLAHKPEAEDVFSMHLVNLAFDHHFLLHAILALAALHLSRLRPALQGEYVLEAEQYHRAAITQFRCDVNDIDNSNFQSVLAFSTTLFPYSWAISTATTNDLEHAFDSVLSSLILTRRVGPMIANTGIYDAMKKSELGRIIPPDVIAFDWSTAEPPTETELVQLRKFSEVIHHVYPPDIIEAYTAGIRFLEVVFEATSRSPDPPSDSLLKSWAIHATPRFIELLSEKQPGALIIFAHYGVLLGRGRHYWFLEGVDELILSIADHFVPTEWANWLQWPKEIIRNKGPTPTAAT